MDLKLFRENYLKGSFKVGLIITVILLGILSIYLISIVFGATIDSITLNSPDNGSFTNNNTPDFNFTVTGNQSSYSCELFLNDSGYGKKEPWHIAGATYDSVTISNQYNGKQGIFFSSNGTKLYEGGMARVYQYTCSDPWNLSSCSYDGIYLFTTECNNPHVLFFKSDGTKLYIGSDDTLHFYQYTCSDPWNLSSCSYDNVNISAQGSSSIEGMFFKPDGTKFYEASYPYASIYQYTCSDPWNLSSCSYDNIYYAGLQNTGAHGLSFKSDGTKFYENGNSALFQHSLSLLNNTPAVIIANQSLSDGTYDWYINCSAEGVTNQSEVRKITIDTASPTINWLKLIITNLGNTISTLLKINAYDLHIDTAKFNTITNSSWSDNETTLDISDTLSQSGTVYVNDSATNLNSYSLNYTLTNNSYSQNTSFSNNLSEQRIYKSDTLYNYADKNLTYNITHYNKYSGTLLTGGTFTGELSNNSNTNLYSEWSGDWLSETEDTYTYFQNTSKTSNLSKQYLINQTYLNITNSAINFTNINISSMCENTLIANLSAGDNQITNCSYVEWSNDWLNENWLNKQDTSKTSNLSKQYLKHRLNVSNSIDVDFTNVNWTFTPISGETLTTSTGTVNVLANSYNDTEYAYGYGDWLSETDFEQYTANTTEAGGNAWIKRDINNTIDINFTNIQNIDREGWTCTKQIINISANQFIENATICNKTNVITKQQSNNTIYNDTVIVDSNVNAYYFVNGSNTDTINYSDILVQTTLPDWATNTSPYIFSINLNSGKTYNLTVNITGKPALETGYTFTKTQEGGGEKNIYAGTIKVYDSAVSEKEIWYYIPKSRLLDYEGGVSKTYFIDDKTSGFSVQDTNTSVIFKIPTTFGSSSLEPGNHEIKITYWTAGHVPIGGGGGPTTTEYLKVKPETIHLNITQPGNYTVELNITWSGPTTTAKFDYSDELIPYIVSPKKFENIELKNTTIINITFYINDTDLAQQITTLIKRVSGKISIKVTHMGAIYVRYVPVDISIYKGVPPPPTTSVCGNGVCEPGENWLNCPEDCGGERIVKGLIVLVISGVIIMIVTKV